MLYKLFATHRNTSALLSLLVKIFPNIFFLFTGMSNSGKTSYIKLLLEQSDKAFSETPSRFINF